MRSASRLFSDERLARRAATGDRRAFAAIYDRYHQPLYRYCLGILGDPQEAQDALQNTMVKAMRALPGERREIRLKPWLYRVAHNESIDLARSRQSLRTLDVEVEAAGERPPEQAEWRERLSLLLGDLEHLPERQRGALLMRELGGFSYEEIGCALDATPAAARQSVHEARLGLRRLQAVREGTSAAPAELAAVAPLPAAAAAELLRRVLGAKGGGGGGLAGGAVGGGVKALGGSLALKSAAAVAVVAAIGAGVADRGALLGTGGSSLVSSAGRVDTPAAAFSASGAASAVSGGSSQAGQATRSASAVAGALRPAADRSIPGAEGGAAPPPAPAPPPEPGGGEPRADPAATGELTGQAHSGTDVRSSGSKGSSADRKSGGKGGEGQTGGSGSGSESRPEPAGPPPAPPGLEGPPPGQGGTPPGLEGAPPGQGGTPPGQGGTPPGQERTPPGQEGAPPGQEAAPPGQERTQPGHGGTPPDQAKKGE